jgi:hypothetical protein
MYLPLDKLVQMPPAGSGASQETVRSVTDAVMREMNNRANGRVRDTR